MSRSDPAWGRPALCVVLALPALPMIWPVVAGQAPWRHAIAPSGALAAQLVLAALAISPLRLLFPGLAALAWIERHRRFIGLAAFGYAAIHVLFFILAIGRLDYILQGLAFASMQTGWLAFALLLLVGTVSNEPARRRLGVWWKRLQRLVYAVAPLVVVHWLSLAADPWTALAWLLPLAVLEAIRLWKKAKGEGRIGS